LGISVAGVVATVVLLFGQLSASAAPSITVTPTTGLTNGQSITVSGAGFTGPIGGITECNTAANEPTVAFLGQQVPVGCTAPKVVPPTGGGFSNQSFTIKEGTVGPPGPGTDSAGHDAAADAALYPCPPTAAQAAAGAVCAIAYGTGANDSATQTITFQSAATTSPTTPVTAAPASTATSAAAATTAPTTAAATAAPATVQGTQATAADAAGQPPAGQVARTGPGTFLAALAVAGVVVLDLGYLTLSSTWTPRRLARQRA
jgi:hypothetical protein